MRASFNGRTQPFQGWDVGSIPIARSDETTPLVAVLDPHCNDKIIG